MIDFLKSKFLAFLGLFMLDIDIENTDENDKIASTSESNPVANFDIDSIYPVTTRQQALLWIGKYYQGTENLFIDALTEQQIIDFVNESIITNQIEQNKMIEDIPSFSDSDDLSSIEISSKESSDNENKFIIIEDEPVEFVTYKLGNQFSDEKGLIRKNKL